MFIFNVCWWIVRLYIHSGENSEFAHVCMPALCSINNIVVFISAMSISQTFPTELDILLYWWEFTLNLLLIIIFLLIRVAVVGNVDAGKSTLLGVLTHGELDNGRGMARQRLFRHKHEMESGRTSSVGNDILGFDSRGDVVNKPDSHGKQDKQIKKLSGQAFIFDWNTIKIGWQTSNFSHKVMIKSCLM